MERLFDLYKNAVFQKDVTAYTALFDEQLQVFDMWMPWSYEGLPVWKEIAEAWFASLGAERVVVNFTDTRVQENGDMGLATATVRFAAISATGEELRFLQNRLTWVGRKTAHGWKIVHQHTSAPVKGDTMQVILQQDL